jgi:hypothetical protein
MVHARFARNLTPCIQWKEELKASLLAFVHELAAARAVNGRWSAFQAVARTLGRELILPDYSLTPSRYGRNKAESVSSTISIQFSSSTITIP